MVTVFGMLVFDQSSIEDRVVFKIGCIWTVSVLTLENIGDVAVY